VPACDHVLALWKHPALDQADDLAKLSMGRFVVVPGLLMVLAIVIVRLAMEVARVDLSEHHQPAGVLRSTLGTACCSPKDAALERARPKPRPSFCRRH